MNNESGNGASHSVGVQSYHPLPFVTPPALDPTRREVVVALLLFFLTLLTTMLAGAQLEITFRRGGVSNPSFLEVLRSPAYLFLGLPFSFTLLGILLFHEMGHYIACRYYGIRSTLPYFLPFPFSIIGTLGAFIRIKAPFVGARALFDVGVAGPIAGFIFSIPALIIGIGRSHVVPLPPYEGFLSFDNFGRPLLFELVAKWLLPHSSATQTINLHPMGWAAWFGLFATCLNLLPIGQLDGGHVTYALFGTKKHRAISFVTISSLVLLSLLALVFSYLDGHLLLVPSYLIFTVVLFLIGLRHPQTLNDSEPVGKARFYVGALALLIFLACFIPLPIRLKS